MSWFWRELEKLEGRWLRKVHVLRAMAVALVILGLGFMLLRGCAPGATGLARHELQLSCATLKGSWRERDGLADDVARWHGSATVITRKDDFLVLFTNAHCLGLESLAMADLFSDGVPEIAAYSMEIAFSTKVARVLKMGIARDASVDAAMLVVDARGLREDQDYKVAPVPRALQQYLTVGREVAAVGNPLEPELFERTVTFGRISALRELVPGVRMIQHDGLINPGNSGGPLFVATDRGWFCVGINAAAARDGVGLGLALAIRDCLKLEYAWAEPDRWGAKRLIQEVYGQRCIVP